MTEGQINPHKITKPMQLLAAWLLGLVATVGIFLTAAIQLEQGSWERSALVIAAIIDVPIFLGALFLLQTKFRAELQEDSFYFEYLSKKTATVVHIEKEAASFSGDNPEKPKLLVDVGPEWGHWRVGVNCHHPKIRELRAGLRRAGIPVAELFGTNTQPPGRWVVAMSDSLPVSHQARLLKALVPFGFAGFVHWEPQRHAGETEDVYIGSYGSDRCVPITAELVEFLDGEVEEIDMKLYVHQQS
jgi:hypothetical protein